MKRGFTLAEVLITLGIIGVVAAITIPTIITKYKKVTTATQLKKVYSTLSQAFDMAKKDYGDMSLWDFTPENPTNGDTTSLKNALQAFAHKYLIPYLNVASDCGVGSNASKDCIYTWHASDGSENTINNSNNNNIYRFILNNSSLILLMYNNYQGDYSAGSVLIYTDINGAKKPNQIGKDIFVMQLVAKNNKLLMYGSGFNRNLLMNAGTWGCSQKSPYSNGSIFCGALIQFDSWDIKDDYPWF